MDILGSGVLRGAEGIFNIKPKSNLNTSLRRLREIKQREVKRELKRLGWTVLYGKSDIYNEG